jgi:hypothetical protein
MTRLGFNCDPTKFRECVYAGLTAKSAVAGPLGATERHLGFIVDRWPVDMTHAGLNLSRDSQSARGVLGKHCGGQSVVGVIGRADGVRLVLRAHDRYHRTEAFVDGVWCRKIY